MEYVIAAYLVHGGIGAFTELLELDVIPATSPISIPSLTSASYLHAERPRTNICQIRRTLWTAIEVFQAVNVPSLASRDSLRP